MSELALVDWLQERLDNSRRIAATNTGDDRNGWLEDALYFTEAIDRIADLEARLAASEKEVERLTEETKHLWDYNNQRQAKIEALEQRVIELTAEVQARNSAVDAQAVQLGKLRAGLAECEGLLRRVDHNLLYSGTASLRAEIDAYFERRKP